MRLESNGSHLNDPTMAQLVVGLTVGDVYRLAWDLDRRSVSPGTNDDPSFGVFLDSQDFTSSLFLLTQPADGYLSYFVDFTATAMSHTFVFAGELDTRSNGVAGSDTDIGYNIDNICLDQAAGGVCTAASVQEPATLAMLGLALAGVAARQSRASVSPARRG